MIIYTRQIVSWRRILRPLKKTAPVVMSACALALAGCVTRSGSQETNSNFVYPNSNVVKLAPTSAKKTKVTILIPPGLNTKDIKNTIGQALQKVPTSNVLLDYKQDTTFVTVPVLPIFVLTYAVEGTAARQSVGTQKLN